MVRTTRSAALQSNHAVMVDLFGKPAPTRKRIKNFNAKMSSSKYAWELFAKETFPNRGYFVVESIATGKDIRVKIIDNLNILGLLRIAKIRVEYPDLRVAQEKIKTPSWSLISGEATEKEVQTKYVTRREAKFTEKRLLEHKAFGMEERKATSIGGLVFRVTPEMLEFVFGTNYTPADYSTNRLAKLVLPSGLVVALDSTNGFSEDYYYESSFIDRTKATYMELCREMLECILAKVPSMKLTVALYLKEREQRAIQRRYLEEGRKNRAILDNIQKIGISTYMSMNIKDAMSKTHKFETRRLDWFESTKRSAVGMTMKLSALKAASMESFDVNVRSYYVRGGAFIKEDILAFLGLDAKNGGYNPTTNIWFYDTPFTQGAENIRIKEKDFSDEIVPEFKRLTEEVFFTGKNNSLLVVERVGLVELKVHCIWFFESLAFTASYTLELTNQGYTLV